MSYNGSNYIFQNNEIDFNIENISAGLKTFVIIKTLLENGSLEENGTLILDEPKIHLHPQWQIIFAEIIVLLHKEFNIHILINSHSPYFTEAIEVYIKKYEIKNFNCYLSEDVNKNGVEFIEVTNSMGKVYDKLARLFQILENERYSV